MVECFNFRGSHMDRGQCCKQLATEDFLSSDIPSSL